ncbi:MAG TPA: M20/M25/M40 family metallo-hydrolase [Actinomycetota bacterium]|jgi:acetylornithine deacetylase/succinyl-diaminopimelate desuccinylase-like protein|nr:M20/M25/M40 family metallo-hydrolase [Actinomycetota bacterium]
MDDLQRRIDDDRQRIVDELSTLVAIPSVGYEGYDAANVRASAEATATILRDAGLAEVRLIELDGGHPAVFGEHRGPDGAPTVLLYAHHDVQPAADPDEWAHAPFEPVVIDGRLYGRGSADDKCGIAIHAAVIRALLADGDPPVTIKVIVEGEEECSTEHLPELVQGDADLLRADVAVVADGGNVRTGVPTITTSVRGATSLEVRVDVLPQAVHSGAFGGPLPDAISALARMIASLHTDDGEVAVDGLHAFEWTGDEVTEEAFRAETNVYPEIQLFGSGSIADRTLSQASINVLAFDAPRVNEVANQIVPTATAVIGLRMAPGEDYAKARQLVAGHLRAAAPWGVRVAIDEDEPGAGYIVDTTSAAFAAVREALSEAFDHEVIEIGSGGSIPLVPLLVETFPGIQVVMCGAADDRSNYHSRDESVDLGEVVRMAHAEAAFLVKLSGR